MKKNDSTNENEAKTAADEIDQEINNKAMHPVMDQEKNTDRYAPNDHSAPDSEYFEFPGIEVTDRKVNRWLIAVYVILAIWSIYYLISFWNG